MTNSTLEAPPKPEVPLTPGIWRRKWYAAGRKAWILDADSSGLGVVSAWWYFDGRGIVLVDYAQMVPIAGGEYVPRTIAGPFDNWPAVEAALILIRGAQ